MFSGRYQLKFLGNTMWINDGNDDDEDEDYCLLDVSVIFNAQ